MNPEIIEISIGLIQINSSYVCIKRNEEPYKDHIEFPGGKKKSNETSSICLIRELKEELDIDIKKTYTLPQIKKMIFEKIDSDIDEFHNFILILDIEGYEEEIIDYDFEFIISNFHLVMIEYHSKLILQKLLYKLENVNIGYKILDNIFKIYKNKLVILVSHQIDALKKFNIILKVKDGKIKKILK